jgi:hypothetical protein
VFAGRTTDVLKARRTDFGGVGFGGREWTDGFGYHQTFTASVRVIVIAVFVIITVGRRRRRRRPWRWPWGRLRYPERKVHRVVRPGQVLRHPRRGASSRRRTVESFFYHDGYLPVDFVEPSPRNLAENFLAFLVEDFVQ